MWGGVLALMLICCVLSLFVVCVAFLCLCSLLKLFHVSCYCCFVLFPCAWACGTVGLACLRFTLLCCDACFALVLYYLCFAFVDLCVVSDCCALHGLDDSLLQVCSSALY